MATLVGATGSSSKKLGAKMWVGASGRILGAVTIGGCIDARVVEAADDVIATGKPVLLDISLDDNEAVEIGLTCGGNVAVAVEPIGKATDPIVAAHQRVAALLATGRAAVVAAGVGLRGRLVVGADGSTSGSLGTPVLDAAVKTRAAELLTGGASGVEAV